MLQTSKQKPRKLKDTLGVTPCQAPCGFKQLLFPLSPLATLVLCPHPALVLWRAGGGVCSRSEGCFLFSGVQDR